MSNLTETKKAVISTRAVYHKYAEVTIEVPSNIKDEDGKKVYDFEEMSLEFENELSKLDDSVVVMCSIE